MKIAFAIVSLFPGGGLQRDCVEIAGAVSDVISTNATSINISLMKHLTEGVKEVDLHTNSLAVIRVIRLL